MSNASAHSGLGQCCLPIKRRRLEESIEPMLDAAAFGNLECRCTFAGFDFSIMPRRLEVLRRDLSVARGGTGLIFRYANLPLQSKEEVAGECGQSEKKLTKKFNSLTYGKGAMRQQRQRTSYLDG